ncbi:hypothetical protein SH661x_000241 [Planctomicrobium sp. SH661]|uniref:hypothetical protein n=1 Tax=Planctomicrobium sp. SH661 TaxID=3448124 RepID=UPI003F5C28A5
MVEVAPASRSALTAGQLNLIARKFGAFSGKTLIDVGCGNGDFVSKLRARGASLQGMEEKGATTAEPGEAFVLGSPSAAVPWESHTQDVILFRGTSIFQAAEFSPELMIGLANLGSSLKAKGHLLIPIASRNPQEVEAELQRWKSQLSVFPGTFRSRLLTASWMSILTLSFLFDRTEPVTVIDFQIDRNAVSRLEWHRLARTAVMSRLSSPAVAAG